MLVFQSVVPYSFPRLFIRWLRVGYVYVIFALDQTRWRFRFAKFNHGDKAGDRAVCLHHGPGMMVWWCALVRDVGRSFATNMSTCEDHVR